MAAAEDSMGLKLSALLAEARPSSAAIRAAGEAAAAVADLVRSVPPQKAKPAAASGFFRDLGLGAEKLAFVFRPPEVVQVAGSHAVGGAARPDVGVDLLVRLPKECFHEKDYLNHQYHAKRCLYLCVIEKSLRSSPLIRKVLWSTFQDEARKPVLLVYPDTEIAELPEFYIRIIPTASSLFNVAKMNLSRNNVRAHSKDGLNLPTPKYSSSILEDMFLEENAEFISNTFADWKTLQEALVLLKVWARQRSSIYMHDCLNGYLISAILAYLTADSGGRIINRSMTTMQIFRVVMKFLATSKMWAKGLVVQPLKQRTISKEDIAQFLQTFDVVICDASGHLNLAFRMTKSAFVELQDEAACTLNCLDKCRDGGFEELFMTKVDFAAKFDSCMRINLKGNAKVFASSFCLDDESWRVCEKDVNSLLQRGLTDRTKMIRVLWRSTPSEWNIVDGFSNFGSGALLAGIMISSLEKSFRLVDVGPNPENRDEAVIFRKFWGEKAELRRFKDGTIAESTVWDSESWEKHSIIKRIANYVLTMHLSLQKEDLIHVVDQLDFCLQIGGKDPVSSSGALFEAFDTLAKHLRLLEEVPLKVSTVQPLDSAFRHTSVFPPEPHPLAYEKNSSQGPQNFAATCVQSSEVMIQLEGSGNWPLDPLAMEKTKSAFLLKIGESLQDRGMFVTASEDEVNVFTSGYSFLLKIFHERGLLLRKQVGDGNTESVPSEDKELFMRSQHSSMINGLHGRYQMYGPVVRLAKRWISAHLFSSFISEEAVELLVAYLFLKPFPFHAPSSRVAGFLRFLRLLSNYDWTFSPMVIDINNDFNLKDEKEINENFMLSRKPYEENPHDVEPAMFLGTTYDKASEAWTKHSPSKSVLKRMASYAKSSAELLTNLILHGQSGQYTWECLFRTPLSNYDAVVALHLDKLSCPHHVLFPAEAPNGKLVIWGKPSKDFHPFMQLNKGVVKSLHDAREKLMVNFDPTKCFLRDLKGAFPATFKVWYDCLGGDAIGLTWEKNTKKRKRDEADEPMLDPASVLKEVGDIGKGLVKGVYLLKAPKIQQ